MLAGISINTSKELFNAYRISRVLHQCRDCTANPISSDLSAVPVWQLAVIFPYLEDSEGCWMEKRYMRKKEI